MSHSKKEEEREQFKEYSAALMEMDRESWKDRPSKRRIKKLLLKAMWALATEKEMEILEKLK